MDDHWQAFGGRCRVPPIPFGPQLEPGIGKEYVQSVLVVERQAITKALRDLKGARSDPFPPPAIEVDQEDATIEVLPTDCSQALEVVQPVTIAIVRNCRHDRALEIQVVKLANVPFDHQIDIAV